MTFFTTTAPLLAKFLNHSPSDYFLSSPSIPPSFRFQLFCVFSQPSAQPAGRPSRRPSSHPSRHPTRQPTRQPTRKPSGQPSRQPSRQPSQRPSRKPSTQPTAAPTWSRGLSWQGGTNDVLQGISYTFLNLRQPTVYLRVDVFESDFGNPLTEYVNRISANGHALSKYCAPPYPADQSGIFFTCIYDRNVTNFVGRSL